MNINGIKSVDYQRYADSLDLVLVCTAEEALEMDTDIIRVYTDNGESNELVETFVGYTKQSATTDAVTHLTTLSLTCGFDGAILRSMQSLVDSNEALRKENEQLKEELTLQGAALEEVICYMAGDE